MPILPTFATRPQALSMSDIFLVLPRFALLQDGDDEQGASRYLSTATMSKMPAKRLLVDVPALV